MFWHILNWQDAISGTVVVVDVVLVVVVMVVVIVVVVNGISHSEPLYMEVQGKKKVYKKIYKFMKFQTCKALFTNTNNINPLQYLNLT